MKIVGEKGYLVRAPRRQPFGRPAIAGLGAAAESETVLVEVCTGDGLVCLGEAGGAVARAVSLSRIQAAPQYPPRSRPASCSCVRRFAIAANGESRPRTPPVMRAAPSRPRPRSDRGVQPARRIRRYSVAAAPPTAQRHSR